MDKNFLDKENRKILKEIIDNQISSHDKNNMPWFNEFTSDKYEYIFNKILKSFDEHDYVEFDDYIEAFPHMGGKKYVLHKNDNYK